MKCLALAFALTGALGAQALPVAPMQMDPEQIARSLRDTVPPIPESDCDALAVLACLADTPVKDVSIRWIQLDDDPELEAILIAEAEHENTYVAYIFDKQETWDLVGSFFCQQWTCDSNSLIRVQKLTDDSPPLVLFHRDLGGSGEVHMTTRGYQLRAGKLWPAFEVVNYENFPFQDPIIENIHVLASDNRLVIHTIREEPPGATPRNKCEVMRWEPAKYTFIPLPSEASAYCDPTTGTPIPDKSHWTGLPVYP